MSKEPEKNPDIAIWFDEDDPTFFLVKVKEGLPHVNLVQTAFDLMARAIRTEPQTVVGQWERDE